MGENSLHVFKAKIYTKTKKIVEKETPKNIENTHETLHTTMSKCEAVSSQD